MFNIVLTLFTSWILQ